MSATEIGFLAFGLVIGIASGAGLAFVIRARPAPSREVRVTVAPDSIARKRPATLASTELLDHSAAAIGAEADRDVRTPVLAAPTQTPAEHGPSRPTLSDTAVGIPITPDPLEAPFRLPVTAAAGSSTVPPAEAAVGPMRVRSPMSPTPPSPEATPPAASDDPRRGDGEHGSGATPAPSLPAGTSPPASGPCAEARQVADERCSLAERARTRAREVAEALAAARRDYDAVQHRLDEAESRYDPWSVRDAKDAAQRAFRGARGPAGAVESAARDWLHEINRINTTAREAQGIAGRERKLLLDLAPQLDRLELEADAARIAAESADVACRDARVAVARCEEEAVQARATPGTSRVPSGPPDLGSPAGTGTIGAAMAVGAGGTPAIVRMLRGDRTVRERLVATLGGADPVERRQWQRRLTDLIEAIVARAIEAAYLDFPDDHRFWGPFTRTEYRDIVSALASLGYRFDGLGGWLDDRMPSQRDLSMAVGYAGLDPMRIRNWPTEAEMETLFRTAFVSASEWLAGAAGELTLGEMIDALGRRADDLADVWNEWGRVRPLLIDTE